MGTQFQVEFSHIAVPDAVDVQLNDMFESREQNFFQIFPVFV